MNDVTVNWKLGRRIRVNDPRCVYSEDIQLRTSLLYSILSLFINLLHMLCLLSLSEPVSFYVISYRLHTLSLALICSFLQLYPRHGYSSTITAPSFRSNGLLFLMVNIRRSVLDFTIVSNIFAYTKLCISK